MKTKGFGYTVLIVEYSSFYNRVVISNTRERALLVLGHEPASNQGSGGSPDEARALSSDILRAQKRNVV